ncbi:MAG: hypothetical protein SFV19_20265 [Rhodospirillaceae bacterium]|nr:hypothetical protein [Rhodospirillaceae bacterium]
MRGLIAGLVALAMLPATATAGGFTPELFDAWVKMRTGGDGKPVYWYAEGHVMNNVTGAVVSKMTGVDTSTVFKDPADPAKWVQLSRKIFLSLDPATGELMIDKATGNPRRPIAYPYQVKTYKLEGDEIVYTVESHDTGLVFQEPPKKNYTARKIGTVTHYNYAMFIDRVRQDGTRSQRFEVNDFLVRADAGLPDAKLSEQERFQYTWVGTGPGPIVSSAVSWRYSSFDAMPSQILKDYIRAKAPLWLGPPKDMAEIASLKAQVPYQLSQAK